MEMMGMETTPESVNFDMLCLYERAFNPQVCKDIADRADKNLSVENTVMVNGVQYPFKGTSINMAQVLQLKCRDWCSTAYKVYYREDADRDKPMKELLSGTTLRLTQTMAFTIKRELEDTWAEEELTRRALSKRGISL
jgi:hypothetical protein